MMLKGFRSQEIHWEKASGKITLKVNANSGDSNGRMLKVKIFDSQKEADVTGGVLSLAWRRGENQGLDAFTATDASKGEFEIIFTTGMLTNIGMLKAALVLVDSTGRIESNPFDIEVLQSVIDDDAVQSENSFTALTEALVKVSQVQADFDGLYQAKSDEMDGLYNEKKADLEELEQDFADRANNLETTYAPRLTTLETNTAGLAIDSEGDVTFNGNKLLWFSEVTEI